MEITIDCELYEIGQFDMYPGAHFQKPDNSIVSIDGISVEQCRQLGNLLYEKVRVRISIERLPVSEE